jgi:hypothetical protein
LPALTEELAKMVLAASPEVGEPASLVVDELVQKIYRIGFPRREHPAAVLIDRLSHQLRARRSTRGREVVETAEKTAGEAKAEGGH